MDIHYTTRRRGVPPSLVRNGLVRSGVVQCSPSRRKSDVYKRQEYSVVKNTMLRRAAEKVGLNELALSLIHI